MNKERFVTFCDAIIAIIITIMVLEIQPPEVANFENFSHLLVPMLAYALSFVTIWGVWRNFHRLFREVDVISADVYWYTGFWIFTQSFFPFATSWVGEAPTVLMPSLFYNMVMTAWMFTFYLIRRGLMKSHPDKTKHFALNVKRGFVPWLVLGVNYIVVWFYPPIVLINLIVTLPFSFMDRFSLWVAKEQITEKR
ncbi:TMEM175 family protein (plasmid) [Lactococcus garvieae]|uniref:TMEM175 family protein n=1 Tax=Lactococcus garvieae TaxID=1363 RepID=UPI0030CB277A